MASGRARAYLAERFEVRDDLGPHAGLRRTTRCAAGDRRPERARRDVRAGRATSRAIVRTAEDFAPEVVVSDFETLAWLCGQGPHGLPVISLDNIQVIDRCRARARRWWPATSRVPDGPPDRAHEDPRRVPLPDHAPSSRPPLRRDRTTLVPPDPAPRDPGRPAPSAGEHLLVYQTAEGNTELPRALAGTGLPLPRLRHPARPGRGPGGRAACTFRPFSEARFVDDLRTARAVVAGGGFTLMGEALQPAASRCCRCRWPSSSSRS